MLVLCSGANTVDAGRLDLARADAAHVRARSGFAIGGVPGIATRLTLLPRPFAGRAPIGIERGAPTATQAKRRKNLIDGVSRLSSLSRRKNKSSVSCKVKRTNLERHFHVRH